MAKMIQLPIGDVTVPKATAQDVQNKINGEENEIAISLQALGLLTNLASYPPTWDVQKTELYKRFAKHSKTSVNSAWKELVDANYMIEFKYREGRKFEYVYYFRLVPFTNEEKEYLLKKAEEEHGELYKLELKKSTSENQKSITSTSDFLQSKFYSTELDSKLSSLKELSSLNKKEEEEEEDSPLISFLLTKGITKENATKFETKLIEKGIVGYSQEDVLKAIELSLDDFINGNCNEPYIWAVGKLERLLSTKIERSESDKPSVNSSRKRTKSTEIIPDWFAEQKAKERQEKFSSSVELDEHGTQPIDIEEEKRKLMDLLDEKRGRSE